MMNEIYLCESCARSRARDDYEDYEVDVSEIPSSKLDEDEQYCICDCCGDVFHIWTYPTFKFYSS